MTGITTELGLKSLQNPDEVGASSVDYLCIMGHLVMGYWWARMAQASLRALAAEEVADKAFYEGKLQTARFYFARLFPEAGLRVRTMRTGSKLLMNTDAALA